MFDERLTLEFDVDSIPALSERRRKIYENVTSAVREGIMTRNEARENYWFRTSGKVQMIYIYQVHYSHLVMMV